jgi:hypothetical protein
VCWLLPCIPQQRLYFFPLPQGQGAFFDGVCCVWVGMPFRMVGLIERHCTQDKRVRATAIKYTLYINGPYVACWTGLDAWSPLGGEMLLCLKCGFAASEVLRRFRGQEVF